MERAMKLAAILFVLTVVLCIFCYNSDDYMAQINNTTTSATTEKQEEKIEATYEVDG